MLDLSDAELQWVVTHLGHSMDVHHTHYRCMQSVIERAKVAKLLILCDNGKMSNYAGKKLDEINMDGVLYIAHNNLARCSYVIAMYNCKPF